MPHALSTLTPRYRFQYIVAPLIRACPIKPEVSYYHTKSDIHLVLVKFNALNQQGMSDRKALSFVRT